MAKPEINNLPSSRVEIKSAISAEEFKSYRPKALAVLGERVKIDGFRPGKAPADVLIKQVGEQAVLEEMAELALADHYPRLLQENKIDALGRPEIRITKMAIGDELNFTILTDVYPAINLPAYEPLLQDLPPAEPITVTEEEVKKLITELAAAGHTEVEKYQEKIKHNLIREKEWQAQERRRREIVKKIAAAIETDLPASLVEGELDKMLAELKGSLEANGFPFTNYLQQINKTEAELRSIWREQAIDRVKFGLFTNALAEKENLTPTAAEVATAVSDLSRRYPDVAKERLHTYAASALAAEAVWKKLESIK